ncbi:hypothetical protein A9G35_02555 [Gilliamella sp. Choc5-1]|nr:hypothetical protein A9G35_02555 [Gilliamella apicola]
MVCLKIQKSIENKLRRQAKADNKTYPSKILQIDTKGFPLLKNQTKQKTREYLTLHIHLILLIFIHKRSTLLKLFHKIYIILIYLNKLSDNRYIKQKSPVHK